MQSNDSLQKGNLHSCKSKGSVSEVFNHSILKGYGGTYGIGHVRYPTAGGNTKEYAQPMYVNSPYGISLAHNGNLSNTKELAEELFHSDLRHISTNRFRGFIKYSCSCNFKE